MHKAVFLDRDGVLNEVRLIEGKPYPPKTLDDLILTPKVHECVNILKGNGYLLFVVTNQPDVARGDASVSEVESIHDFLLQQFPIDGIRVCYHDNQDGCACRKPLPGMLHDISQEFNIDLSNSYMIGDRWKDIDAGCAAGCKTIWLDYQYQEKKAQGYTHKANSLYEACLIIKGD